MKQLAILTVCLLLISALSTATAQEPSTPKVSDKTLLKLKGDLSSDQFQRRQAATQSLISAGEQAIPSMIELAYVGDAEAKVRARQILRALSKSTQQATSRPAKVALKILSEHSEPEVAIATYHDLQKELARVSSRKKTLEFKSRIRKQGDLLILDVSRSSISDDDLSTLKYEDLPKFDGFEASATSLTGAGLKHLKGLPLKKLGLHSAKITDAGIAHCKGLPLNELSLGFTGVTDAGLKSLVDMPIEVLMLARTKITDRGMKHLAQLPLKNLNLTWVDISDEGLEHLKDLKLEQLSISSPKITDAGIAKIKSMPLKVLMLGGTSITDEGVKHLTEMPLQFLWLYDTKVTDKALNHLKKIDSLQTLYIQRTEFSEKAAAELRKSVKLVHTGRKK